MRKYNTIVIDFPWPVGKGGNTITFGGARLQKTLPYKEMSYDDIKQYPINDYAAEESSLFLWVTHTTLPFGLELVKSWGFKYHCLLTWDKTNGLCIRGIHRKTENIIFAYRGRMTIKQKGKAIPTLFTEKLTKHSAKPDIFYSIIQENTLEPRVDIFARKRHFGFDAVGDQVEPLVQETLN